MSAADSTPTPRRPGTISAAAWVWITAAVGGVATLAWEGASPFLPPTGVWYHPLFPTFLTGGILLFLAWMGVRILRGTRLDVALPGILSVGLGLAMFLGFAGYLTAAGRGDDAFLEPDYRLAASVCWVAGVYLAFAGGAALQGRREWLRGTDQTRFPAHLPVTAETPLISPDTEPILPSWDWYEESEVPGAISIPVLSPLPPPTPVMVADLSMLVFPKAGESVEGPPPDFPVRVRRAGGLWLACGVLLLGMVGVALILPWFGPLSQPGAIHILGSGLGIWSIVTGIRARTGKLAGTWEAGFASLLAGAGALTLPAAVAAEAIVAANSPPPPPTTRIPPEFEMFFEEDAPRFPKKPTGPSSWQKRFGLLGGSKPGEDPATWSALLVAAIVATGLAGTLIFAGGSALAADPAYTRWRKFHKARDHRRMYVNPNPTGGGGGQ